jgi:pyruvate dehydrogenase E1 component alpha subunit
LLEFSTYRWLEHCGPHYDNDIGYRTEAEYLDWRAREPVASFESTLLAQGIISAAEIAEMDSDIEQEVKAAFDFAEASPFPPAADAYTDLCHVPPSLAGARTESVGG